MYINKKLIVKIFICPFIARILEVLDCSAGESGLAKRQQTVNPKRGFDEVSLGVRAR